METIGTRLRHQREEKKLTMNQIQELTGISKGNLSGMENDKNKPSVSALLSLSQILGCSIDWLLTGNNFVPKSEQNPLTSEFTISEHEKELLTMLRVLSSEQQSDIYDFVYLKYKKICDSKKEYIRSMNTDRTDEKTNSSSDENENISIT